MVEKIYDALDSLAAWLCQVIYQLIAYLYRLFYNLGDLRIINNENISPIYNRITLILGLVMLFFVIFQLIQYVINPDNFMDKEKGFGKVMIRMVVSVALIGIVPTLFDFAFELQSDILKNNLIPKIILGTKDSYNEDWGGTFSASVLDKFYKLNPNVSDYTCRESNNISARDVVNANITSLSQDGRLNTMALCLNERAAENNEKIIQFDGLLAVLSGALVTWMLVMYCLDLGVRVVQLTYLQIIAPIPIIMYMVPKKDGAFEKWTKQCLTTFLDLFIRTAIICFVVLIISTLSNSFSDITSNVSASGQGDTLFTGLLYVCLVLGVMTFAKKAGDMLKELFPKGGVASGELGLSTKNRIPEPAKRVAGAGIGLAAVGAVGAARSIAGNVKYSKQGKEEKADLKNRLQSAKTAYSNAMRTANDTTKSQKERDEARMQAAAHKREINSLNSDLTKANKKYSTARMIGGTVAGTLSAANKGMIAGLTTKGGIGGVSKATKSVINQNKAIEEWRENGGTSSIDRTISGIKQGIGINPTQIYERRKETIDKENAAYGEYDKYVSAAEDRAGKLISEGKYEKASQATKDKAIEATKSKNMAEILRTQAGNLKLSDYAGDEAKYRAAVDKLNQQAMIEEQKAIAAEKDAKVMLIQDIIDGKVEDAAISQNINSAQTVIKSNGGLSGFASAVLDSFKALKDTNNKAKDAKSKNNNELYTMQNSSEYKAAQADKKYNESGKK